MIKFECPNCSHKIGAPDDYAGKKARCSKCKQPVRIPAAAPAQQAISDNILDDPPVRLAEDNDNGKDMLGGGVELSALIAGDAIEVERPAPDEEPQEPLIDPRFANLQHQAPPERKFPWPIDMLLYPFSKGGASFFFIAVGLPLLINAVIWWFERLGDMIPTFYLFTIVCISLSFIVKVVILLYTFWYFCHCIRDSSEGNLRAPDVLAENPSIGELFGQILRMDLCFMIMFAPLIYYLSIPLKPYMPKILFTWPFFLLGWIPGSPSSPAEMYAFFVRDEVFFFSLVGITVFFLPMAWLATVMFDSIQGLNPITLIRSVFNTFFRYCPVALSFYLPVMVTVVSVKIFVACSIPFLISTLMLKIVTIYTLTVCSHLLGRFYYKNEEKLYWEV